MIPLTGLLLAGNVLAIVTGDWQLILIAVVCTLAVALLFGWLEREAVAKVIEALRHERRATSVTSIRAYLDREDR